MAIRPSRVLALSLAAAFLCSLVPALAQTTTTTNVEQFGETGTQTVTVTQNADGTTTTTTTTNLSGPVTNGQTGATYQTDNDTTTVTKDANGHELSRHEVHEHYNWDKKGGKVIGSTTRTWDETTNWTTGVRTVKAHTEVINGSTDTTTTIDYTSEWTYFGGGGTGHWEETGGHQTVRKQHDDDPPERTERDYEWPEGHWTDFHTISQLFPATPQAGTGNDTESVSLPSVAGPTSEIVATVEDPSQDGPVDEVTVQVQDAHGHSHFYDTFTDPDGHLDFALPANAASVALFTHFTRDGAPDDAAAHCVVSAHGEVAGTDAVPNAPQTGPAIERASSAYEQGGAGRNLIALQTRGVDPLRARVLLDGSSNDVETVAASNVETVGRFDGSVALGRHTISVSSANATSNAFPADFVSLHADPLGVTETGSVQTVTVHVDGLPASDSATMYFSVGGAAELAAGGSMTAVPVSRGVAQVRIRGVHSGAALVQFHLHAQIAGFWT